MTSPRTVGGTRRVKGGFTAAKNVPPANLGNTPLCGKIKKNSVVLLESLSNVADNGVIDDTRQ